MSKKIVGIAIVRIENSRDRSDCGSVAFTTNAGGILAAPSRGVLHAELLELVMSFGTVALSIASGAVLLASITESPYDTRSQPRHFSGKRIAEDLRLKPR